MTDSFVRAVSAAAIGIVFLISIALTASAQNPNVCEQNARLTRPFQLGVSGGNSVDRGPMTCFEGTLGSLVLGSDKSYYILSTNRVLARSNRSAKGAPIVQPGLVDGGCKTGHGNIVARLTKQVKLSFAPKGENTVDAAIAKVQGMVDPNDPSHIGDVRFGIVNIPGLFDQPITAPLPGLSVQKMGAATCVTTGSILAVGVNAAVTYGPNNQVANFKCQIAIEPVSAGKLPNPNIFSTTFDSGALVLTAPPPTATATPTTTATPDPSATATLTPTPTATSTPSPMATPTFTPQPVGMVIASSTSDPNMTITIANPICSILTAPAFAKFQLQPDNTAARDFKPGDNACPAPTATPTPSAQGTPVVSCPLIDQNPTLQEAAQLRDAHEAELMSIPGAIGTGIGISEQTGEPVIQVYIRKMTQEALDAAPAQIGDTAIMLMETGDFVSN